MKLHTSGSPVEVQGQIEQGSFGIKQSPKAFQILSSGLYSNKPMAIVRELSANAADAHVLNGNKKVPFEIKLPNRLDNQFYIKDFGPGLSHEEVMKLYTTYFESTKSESNDFIGGLGLGSKSPFSYTDSFTVEARQKGMKRTYSAFVAESGIPQIVQLGISEKTNEPDGLTIGFPVSPGDYAAFAKEAQRILPWFEPAPTVLGASITPLPEPLRVAKGVSVYSTIPVWNEGGYYNNSADSTYVRMGNVIYPLSWADAGLEEDTEMMSILNHGRNCYVFDIPIGDVEVAASREGLQYDRSTKANLKKVALTFMNTIGGVIEADIQSILKQATPFEAVQRIHQMEVDWGFNFAEASKIFANKGLKYPGLKKASEILLPADDYTTFKLARMDQGARTATPIVKGRVTPPYGSPTPVSILPGHATMVVEVNTKGYIGATKELLVQKPSEVFYDDKRCYSNAIMIIPHDIKKLDDPAYIAERDAFIKKIGSPPLHQTSEHEPARKQTFAVKNSIAKEEAEVYVIKKDAYSASDVPKTIMAVDDIESWVKYNATSMVVIFENADGSKSELKDLRQFKKAFDTLKEIAKKEGFTVPGNLIGTTNKSVGKIMKAGVESAPQWMARMLMEPKIQQALSNIPPQKVNNASDWTIRNSSDSMISSIVANKEFFKKLGGNWAVLSTIQGSTTDWDNITSGFQEYLTLHKLKPAVTIKKIDTASTYKKLFKDMPMLAATLNMMGDSALNKKDKTLLQDIEMFLKAKGNPDVKLDYLP